MGHLVWSGLGGGSSGLFFLGVPFSPSGVPAIPAPLLILRLMFCHNCKDTLADGGAVGFAFFTPSAGGLVLFTELGLYPVLPDRWSSYPLISF